MKFLVNTRGKMNLISDQSKEMSNLFVREFKVISQMKYRMFFNPFNGSIVGVTDLCLSTNNPRFLCII